MVYAIIEARGAINGPTTGIEAVAAPTTLPTITEAVNPAVFLLIL